MALYAFDGTWNHEHSAGEYGQNTNVVKFRDAYTEQSHFYTKGVGTKMGLIGRWVGGAFGAGGEKRIELAKKELAKNWANGDTVIDIVGFSRGSALALHFANVISSDGVRHPDTRKALAEKPPIRFLGLWDVVAAFGIPINLLGIPCQRINLGYHLRLAPNVQHCYHAMALDERRGAFRVTRVKNGYEVWFRGVHSDIGGGNGNEALSNIALRWMFRKATLAGLPIDAAKAAALDSTINPEAKTKPELDPIKNEYRSIKTSDLIHFAVSNRPNHNNPPESNPRESLQDEMSRITAACGQVN